jgi:histidinol-phosphatase (PHP family)
MTANYHTHTYRCGHASGTEREYVEKAIELGFTELGFSEHAPMPFPKEVPAANLERLLSMRLKMHETEEYFNTLLALREEYKKDIKIHIGLETEYFDCCFDAFLDYIKDYPLDYLMEYFCW